MAKTFLPLVISTVSLGSAASFGQSVPQSPAPTRPQPTTMDHLSAAQLSTQYLMQNNGGSLLQAQELQPGDPSRPDANRNGSSSSYNIYSVAPPEPHVLKKHDLVNIVVNEDSASKTSGTSDQERQVDFDAKVDAFVKFNLAKMSLLAGTNSNAPEVQMNGSRDFKATGEYDREDTMTTRLEAEVIDVKPDGKLEIQARRHLKIDEEEITVVLTGECRVQDVDASNSVLSTDLHDLDLQKSTKGEVHDTNKRGLIHRLLDILNPF
jgi:flagellar L-ring protein precursor FlgH